VAAELPVLLIRT